MPDTLTVPRRFRGPPDSGNGGYCCGLLAARLDGDAEVTLRSPPPLDRPLRLEAGETLTLYDGPTLVAEARARPLELTPPAPVSVAEAREGAARYTGFSGHAFPTCFVCGPEREEGDGLRVFAGRTREDGPVAAPWIPALGFGAETPAPIVWAALDCPGYFALAREPVPALLGRMHGSLRAPVRGGEEHVVVGWELGREGRKLFAGTALFDAAGTLCALARQTWIVLG